MVILALDKLRAGRGASKGSLSIMRLIFGESTDFGHRGEGMAIVKLNEDLIIRSLFKDLIRFQLALLKEMG